MRVIIIVVGVLLIGGSVVAWILWKPTTADKGTVSLDSLRPTDTAFPTSPSTMRSSPSATPFTQSAALSLFDDRKVRLRYPSGWVVRKDPKPDFGSLHGYYGLAVQPPEVPALSPDFLVSPRVEQLQSQATGIYVGITELGYLTLGTVDEALEEMKKLELRPTSSGDVRSTLSFESAERIRVGTLSAYKILQTERTASGAWKRLILTMPVYPMKGGEGLWILFLYRVKQESFNPALAEQIVDSFTVNEGVLEVSGTRVNPGVEGNPL